MSTDKDTSDTSKFYSRNPTKWEAQSKKLFLRKDRVTESGFIMTIDNFTHSDFDVLIAKLTDEQSVELVDYLLLQEELGKKLGKKVGKASGLIMTINNYSAPVFKPILDKMCKNERHDLMDYLIIKDQRPIWEKRAESMINANVNEEVEEIVPKLEDLWKNIL